MQQLYLTVFLEAVPAQNRAKLLQQAKAQLHALSAPDEQPAEVKREVREQADSKYAAKDDSKARGENPQKTESLLLQAVHNYARLSMAAGQLQPLFVSDLLKSGTFIEELDAHVGRLESPSSMATFSYALISATKVEKEIAVARDELAKPGALAPPTVSHVVQNLGRVSDCLSGYTYYDSVADLTRAVTQRVYGRLIIEFGEARICTGVRCMVGDNPIRRHSPDWM